MAEEEDILKELGEKFVSLAGKGRIARARRIFLEVPAAEFAQVFLYVHREMKFSGMTTITGQDVGTNLTAMYHMTRVSGVVLNLIVAVPKENPVLPTVTPYFPAADAYERELIDLLGMKVEGLAPGARYPLPDGWPEGQYPLRKEWNAKMLDGAPASAMPDQSFFKASENAEESAST